jgi:hypothetical protein
MPAPRANEKHFFARGRDQIGAALICVDASRDRVTVVGLDRSRATGKGCEDEDGTESGKQNGSHNFVSFI